MTTTWVSGLLSRLRAPAGPGGPAPEQTARGRLFDTGLALLVLVSEIQYAADPDGPTGRHRMTVLVCLAALASVPLAWRRRYPLAVLWIVLAANMLTPGDVTRLTFYACVIAAYSAAAYSPHRMAATATLALAVLVTVTIGRSVPHTPFGVEPTVPTQYVPLLIAAPLVMATLGLRTWKVRAGESRLRLAEVERRQAEALRSAVEHERARIARELHDVVTHNVSVMVIQAGAARKIMDSSPERAREALLAVEEGGRTAMGELRQVMGLLTMDDPEETELEPQPGLERLGPLVERARGTGTPVELSVSGAVRPLPGGVELTAYRVVQEALTNALKHASGSRAVVCVDYGKDELRVEVTDSGGTSGSAAATGNGRGLIGLRERLAVYGGTLANGPRPLGGYRVRALIPLERT
ncbi:sensor histidine kinase [Streptomyces fuscichromogenes]|uniref:histidine kinase n=1 Tax=Streptomyces fuscichromogenes TaxID=1324013 RepID=A0A918CVR2_9ACTN|nr:histidine kinase [Streptomyces fuscichromogenes]GGN35226.1 two-component sensor histidine kinase [Streptomyces fuscichromogenes]